MSVDSRPDLQDLSTIPNTNSKWYEIGVQLGVDRSVLNSIKTAQNNDLKRKREMFRRLLGSKPHLTWKDVLHALIDIGCNDSAELTCQSFDWPISVLEERGKPIGRSTSGDELSQIMLESLKPPDSEEATAVSVRSSIDSDEFHSAPSAGDDLGTGFSTFKSSTTNFGTPLLGPKGSPSSPRARTELQSSFKPFHQSSNIEFLGTGLAGEASILNRDLQDQLSKAIYKGDIDTVMKIFSNHPECVDSILNEKRQTALMIAAIEGHKELVSYLLDKKASVSHVDIEGATVVFATASVGNYEVLKLLLSNPRAIAEINTKNRFGKPILLDPASKGFSMVSEYLLENRANPNDTTRDGVTPLYKACEKGQKEVAKVLLEHGADVLKPCLKTSKTPLQEAVDSEHAELIPVLVKALKRVNEKNAKLFTVTTVESLRALVNSGADVDSREKNGITPLMVHTMKKEKDLVQELIKLRANVDLQDNDGFSALMMAAKHGDAVLVQILIGASAILDFKEKEMGLTALMLATIGLHSRVVKELVLAKANINIKSRDDRTALDMAKELKCKDIIDLLTPTQTQSTNGDPFIDLLTEYLSEKDRARQAQRVVPASASSIHKPMTPKPVSQSHDETSDLREELKKSYRRIADLETRVHDLTLQSSLELPPDTDLSYMDRSRLETEFRKTKELKKKAEQYAIEAKQAAQRLSAENFKLKEDLSKERHHNELARKHLLREMEQKVDKQAASADLLNAKKEVFEREISIRAHQLLRAMPREQMSPTDNVFELCPEEVIKIMLTGRVRVSTVLLAVTGLPYSGKTTLLRKVLAGSKDPSSIPVEKPYQIPGFRMYEAIMRRDLVDNSMDIFPSVKQQAETHAIATVLIQQLTSQRQSIKIADNFANCPNLFGEDSEMYQYSLTTCQCLSDLILDLERTNCLSTLVRSALTFINFYDVGMNKSVFEVVPPLLAGHCRRIVQVNALNLAIYGTTDALGKPPPLKSFAPLTEKYSPRSDDQLMVLSNAKDYFLQFVSAAHGYSKQTPSTLLVATNNDKIHNDNEVKTRKRNVHRLIRRRAEELGLAKVLCKDFIDVNATIDSDCNKVKAAILKLINSQRDFLEVDMPLNALFLRCFLNNKKLLFISRTHLLEYAKKVGIDELDDFLSIFLNCGSLFCSMDRKIPFLFQYIILDPPKFIQEMDKLYYLEFHAKTLPADLDAEVRNTKMGIVTDRLVKKIWAGISDDQVTTYDFCLRALLALKFIVPIKRSLLPIESFPDLPEHGDCYFMPTVRTAFCNRQRISYDSLFILHNTDIVPFHKLGQFVKYFQSIYENFVQLKPCDAYNQVEFDWIQDVEGIPSIIASVSVIFQSGSEAVLQGGVVEVKMDMKHEHKNSELKNHICSIIKTACVHVFHETSEEIPTFEYKLAVACPLQPINPLKKQRSHFLPFQILPENCNKLFCSECDQVATDQEVGRLSWIQAMYQGPRNCGTYKKDLISDEELIALSMDLVKHYSPRNLVKLGKELGQAEQEFFETSSTISLSEKLYTLLFNWKEPRQSLSKQCLGALLDKCGFLVEACKIDIDYFLLK